MSPSPSPPENGPQGWASPFEELISQQPEPPAEGPRSAGIERPGPMFGTPGQDASFWEGSQSYPDDCAIKCQQVILEQFTNCRFDEGALVREAWEHGWYTPGGGTASGDVGKVLELHGVGVHRCEHASIFHLAQELAQGHKVIVGVDSKELWEGNSVLEEALDAMGLKHADHAVVVSGIDTSDPDHVRVLVSDPGTGQPTASYPLEQFLDAWRDSDFFLMATDEPAPPHLPEMVHFDYDAGHVPEVADVPYEQFLEYAGHPDDWAELVHRHAEADCHDRVDQHLVDYPMDDPLPDHTDAPDTPGAFDLHHDHLEGLHHPGPLHDQPDAGGHFSDDHLPDDLT